MENGRSLINSISEPVYGGQYGHTADSIVTAGHKLTILNYKTDQQMPYATHPLKRPVQSVGTGSQTNSRQLQQQEVLERHQQVEHTKLPDKVEPDKIFMTQAEQPTPRHVIQVGQVSHGYHPGRHLQHQLQLRHSPQGTRVQAVPQLTHIHRPVVQYTTAANQDFAPANLTYTRTYPQTNQYSPQQTPRQPLIRTRVMAHPISSPNEQLVRFSRVVPVSPQRFTSPQTISLDQNQQISLPTTTPRYVTSNIAQTQSVTTEKLSHFDYGESDFSINPSAYNRTQYQRTNKDDRSSQSKSQIAVPHSLFQLSHIPSYSPATQQHIISELRPTNYSCHPTIISTEQHMRQPNIITPQQSGDHRTPLLIQSSNNTLKPGSQNMHPVIISQQSGTILRHATSAPQGTPVILQVNGNQNIRGSIVSLSQSNNSTPPGTHVYFTIPQGNQLSAAKFVKTPDGHLRPVNGVALQSSLNQSKMYTVRYAVTPKGEDSIKPQPQYTIYSPIVPSNNNNIKYSLEKTILPKSSPSSPSSELSRKRKTSFSRHPPALSKVSKMEMRQPPVSSPHVELIQRVSKSLDADQDVVQNPNTTKPFDSFTDGFRRLMKYHIFFEPDHKESHLKKIDRINEEVCQKLLHRKENLQNRLHYYLLENCARPLPHISYSCDYITLLSQSIADEREGLEQIKTELKEAKEAQLKEARSRDEDAEQASTSNASASGHEPEQ